ncbi:MAG: hypothetical protein AAF741_17775 [Bacteroidota bacterium]
MRYNLVLFTTILCTCFSCVVQTSVNSEKENLGSSAISGLGDRAIVKSELAEIENDSGLGIVVIRICIDAEGNVVDAEYTMQGSTSNDPRLINASLRSARKFKFEGSNIDRQCGKITYNFKAQ